jgi:hypothetical protein
MATQGTVEHFQHFDVHVLHRTGGFGTACHLSVGLVSMAWIGSPHGQHCRLDIEFRAGQLQHGFRFLKSHPKT